MLEVERLLDGGRPHGDPVRDGAPAEPAVRRGRKALREPGRVPRPARLARPTLGRAARVIYNGEARKNLRALLAEARVDVAHLHNIAHQLSPSILDELAERACRWCTRCTTTSSSARSTRSARRARSASAARAARYVERRTAALQRRVLAALAHEPGRGVRARAGCTRYARCSVFLCPSLFVMAKMLEFGVARERLAFLPHFVDARALHAVLRAAGATPCSPDGSPRRRGC